MWNHENVIFCLFTSVNYLAENFKTLSQRSSTFAKKRHGKHNIIFRRECFNFINECFYSRKEAACNAFTYSNK